MKSALGFRLLVLFRLWQKTSMHMTSYENGNGASAFVADYTYHLVKGQEYSLGTHMLEVCPSVAAAKPRIEVHPLGIGDREEPARLVFEGKEGDAIVIDMGGCLRLICQDIHCVKPIMPMPNLPVARVMWQAEPSLTTGVEGGEANASPPFFGWKKKSRYAGTTQAGSAGG